MIVLIAILSHALSVVILTPGTTDPALSTVASASLEVLVHQASVIMTASIVIVVNRFFIEKNCICIINNNQMAQIMNL